MVFIDGTVVNVALPALQSALRATLADVQWVVESYSLFFAGADVCSIVLEVANAVLGPKRLGLWHHRTLDGASGKWVQADRGARPSQAVFLSGEQNGLYMG